MAAIVRAVQAGLSELKASFEEPKSKPNKESELKPRPLPSAHQGVVSLVQLKINLTSVHIALFVVIQVILRMALGNGMLQTTVEAYGYPGATHSSICSDAPPASFLFDRRNCGHVVKLYSNVVKCARKKDWQKRGPLCDIIGKSEQK